MKKWFFDKQDNRDREKLAKRAKARNELRQLMETGDEQGYKEYVKRLKPTVTDEEMEILIDQFHEQRAVHPSDAWNRP
jgi:flagellar biosynthesis/type III secretory pathway protein FliH